MAQGENNSDMLRLFGKEDSRLTELLGDLRSAMEEIPQNPNASVSSPVIAKTPTTNQHGRS